MPGSAFPLSISTSSVNTLPRVLTSCTCSCSMGARPVVAFRKCTTAWEGLAGPSTDDCGGRRHSAGLPPWIVSWTGEASSVAARMASSRLI